MKDQEGLKKRSNEKDTTSESKPEMCGWALLQMAKDKKQSRQSELPEYSKKE